MAEMKRLAKDTAIYGSEQYFGEVPELVPCSILFLLPDIIR